MAVAIKEALSKKRILPEDPDTGWINKYISSKTTPAKIPIGR
jgi:hypothetical protein